MVFKAMRLEITQASKISVIYADEVARGLIQGDALCLAQTSELELESTSLVCNKELT